MINRKIAAAGDFAAQMRIDSGFRFRSSRSASETVYASCFAAMIWRYDGTLESRTTAADRQAWASYIQGFQDKETGYFNVPEIVAGGLASNDHDKEHLLMHFCAHALPALAILGSTPRFDLTFAEKFIDLSVLDAWLKKIDWKISWLEGNNLLFVGQFLIHIAEKQGRKDALPALEHLMDWLDKEMDPRSGLWGTNGFCDDYAALYGGYHQLLLYWYLNRPHQHPKGLVDTVLKLQHFDGGFHPYRGGGTCQDVDAVDVLANIYKRNDYRRRDIESSLQRAWTEVSARQMDDGGFIDRRDLGFCHMGIEATRAPAGESNMFSTWFGVHTLLLIDQVLGSEKNLDSHYSRFNDVCSMGWHDGVLRVPRERNYLQAGVDIAIARARRTVVDCYGLLANIRDGLRRMQAG